MLAGRNNDEISKDLEISRATVKWHMHNVFAKTNTGNRESLLRLALQLGGVRESEIETDIIEIEDLIGDDRAREVVNSAREAANAATMTAPIPAAAVPSKSWF